MHKYKARYYFIIFAFACVVLVGRWATSQADDPPSRVYYPTFRLNRQSAGKINCYRVKHTRTHEDTARFYAGLFGLPHEYKSDDEGYTFVGEAGRLTVYRHKPQLTFVPARPLDADAEGFFDDLGLTLYYEQIHEATDGTQYTLSFVGFVDNLLSYALCPALTLDADRRIIQADYFFAEYEKLGECRIKPMRDAFLLLPQDQDGPVTLTSCRLVYVYANSIVQPAYMFVGRMADQTTVEYIINAAAYKA